LKNKFLLFAVIAAVHITVFFFSFNGGTVFTRDSAEYLQQASNIQKYHSWYCGSFNETIQPELYSQRPPLYGFFITVIRLFNSRFFLISLIQSLISILNIYIAVKIIEKYAGSGSKPWLIIASLIFFPSQLIYANFIMSEILLQHIIMISTWYLLLFNETKSIKHLLHFQFTVTCAILTKPVFIAFPLFTVIALSFIPGLKSARKKIFYSHLIPLSVIILVSFNNYRHTGYFEYSSITRKLSVNYHALYSTAMDEGETAALQQIDSIQKVSSAFPDYAERASSLQSASGRLIGQHFGSYIYLSIKGILLFFVDHSRYDIAAFCGQKSDTGPGITTAFRERGITGTIKYLEGFNAFYLIYLIASMIFNATLLTGMIRFCFLKYQPLYVRLLIAGTILYVALLTGMTGTTRFRMPVFLLLLAANSITLKYYYWPFFKKRSVSAAE
jgi:hypothetical protein